MQDLKKELDRILDCIRKHRDQRGDDRCWRDDVELYQEALPEGVAKAELALPPPLEMLGNCIKYVSCRHDPSQEYVSPQRTIEELEKQLKPLKQKVLDEYWRGFMEGYRDGYRDKKDNRPYRKEYELGGKKL